MTNIKLIDSFSTPEIVLVGKTKTGQSVVIDCPLGFLNNRTEVINLLKTYSLSIEDFGPEGYSLVKKGYEHCLGLEFTKIKIIKEQIFEDFDNILNSSRH